ncbi:hypothetical protein FJZ31_27135 [Candidatus Poribacteria bacterium]|nr:hypothetical protein [Candidatus Poribacteria bacterium]
MNSNKDSITQIPNGKTSQQVLSKSQITFRSLILASLLIPINGVWLIQMEELRYSGHPTTASLFFNVVFWVLVLVLLNFLLKRILPKFAFSQGELVTIYAMLAISSAISGHDALVGLPSALGHTFWFATPENDWEALFIRYIPNWLSISDKSVLHGYYRGEATLYTAETLKAWIPPLAYWSIFYLVILFMMLCINAIFCRQWTQRERLSYPIIQLPLELTKEGGSSQFWKSNLLWVGFALAGSLDLINGLHYLLPSVPLIPVKARDISYLFTEKPLDAMGSTKISFYPFAIGLCFFAPLELLFSAWFFYVFSKIQKIIGSMMGWSSIPGFPYYDEQLFGAAIGLLSVAIWNSRAHLLEVFRKTLNRKANIDDSEEPLSYRGAVLGLFGGLAFLVFFCQRTGMSAWIVVIYFAIYFGLWTTITKIRAQLGPPVHDFWAYTSGLSFGHPDMMLVPLLGTRRLGPRNLTMFSFFWWFNKAYRGHPAPHQLEAFKLAEASNTIGINKFLSVSYDGTSSSFLFDQTFSFRKRKSLERKVSNSRRLFWGLVIASVLGVISCLWTLLHFSYKTGAPGVDYYGGLYFNGYLSRWLTHPQSTNYAVIIAIAGGLIFTIFLMSMRMRFLSWPFHPVGYALSGSWTMNLVWLIFFISWLLKLSILRHGGLKAYRKAMPFFFGLILGEFTIGTLWSIVGVLWNVPAYAFWY